MLVQYERPDNENKYMEHLIENSSDSDDTVNDTNFDQSEINDLVHSLGL